MVGAGADARGVQGQHAPCEALPLRVPTYVGVLPYQPHCHQPGITHVPQDLSRLAGVKQSPYVGISREIGPNKSILQVANKRRGIRKKVILPLH
eukprot:709775-Prorocentrum_minimum.AAC.2